MTIFQFYIEHPYHKDLIEDELILTLSLRDHLRDFLIQIDEDDVHKFQPDVRILPCGYYHWMVTFSLPTEAFVEVFGRDNIHHCGDKMGTKVHYTTTPDACALGHLIGWYPETILFKACHERQLKKRAKVRRMPVAA